MNERLRRAELAAAVLLTGVALFLHVTFLTHAGALWRDEVNSVEFARMPSLGAAFHALRYDSFPMLMTVVLRGWMAIVGEGDRELRILGFVVGILFLGALWLAARMLGGRAPLVAMALVGINPWVVQTVDSIRPYGIGVVFIVLTVGLVWRALERPSAGRFVAAASLGILSVQAMYQNAFLLMAICFAGIVVCLRRRDLWSAGAVIGIGVVAAVTLIPYLHTIESAREWTVLLQVPTHAAWLLDPLHEAIGAGVFLPTLWGMLAVLCIVAALRGLGSQDHRRSGPAYLPLYCGVALVASTAAFFVALVLAHLRAAPWYYVSLLALIVPMFDAVIWLTNRPTSWRVGEIAAVLAIAGLWLMPAMRQVAMRRTNIDIDAELLAKEASPGDLIVVNPWFNGVSFHRYYKGHVAWTTIPAMEEIRIHRYDLLKAKMKQPDAIEPVLNRIAEAFQSGHQIWLVGTLPATPADHAPVVLPAAPASPSGWLCGNYINSWGQQVAYLLETHATQGRIVRGLSSGTVNRAEDVPISVASGWR